MINRKFAGYLTGIVAAAAYGTNPLFALPLYGRGMTTDSVLLFRYLIGTAIVFLMLRVRGSRIGASSGIDRRSGLMLVVMGLLVALSSLGLFESYLYMDAAVASTLLFVYPVMVAVLMVIVFRERFSLLSWLCIFLSLGGISLLFKGEGGSSISVMGTTLVMLSSLCYALYIVGMKLERLKRIPALQTVFCVLLTGSVLFGVKSLVSGTLTLPPDLFSWSCVTALAFMPTVLSFFCTTRAIEMIGPTPTAILGAFEPVTAVLIGLLVFGETLTLLNVIGIALIVGAVIVDGTKRR